MLCYGLDMAYLADTASPADRLPVQLCTWLRREEFRRLRSFAFFASPCGTRLPLISMASRPQYPQTPSFLIQQSKRRSSSAPSRPAKWQRRRQGARCVNAPPSPCAPLDQPVALIPAGSGPRPGQMNKDELEKGRDILKGLSQKGTTSADGTDPDLLEAFNPDAAQGGGTGASAESRSHPPSISFSFRCPLRPSVSRQRLTSPLPLAFQPPHHRPARRPTSLAEREARARKSGGRCCPGPTWTTRASLARP